MVGGTGLIGAQILSALHAGGHAAVGIARTPGALDTDVVVGDVTGKPAALRRAIGNARLVIHAAPYVGRDVVTSEHANVHGTRTLVDVCAKSDVERILYVSTAAVYGMGPH
ncbi:MAG: NAD-dependent epimerase/dehydratase family protein [Microbacterium sp.]